MGKEINRHRGRYMRTKPWQRMWTSQIRNLLAPQSTWVKRRMFRTHDKVMDIKRMCLMRVHEWEE